MALNKPQREGAEEEPQGRSPLNLRAKEMLVRTVLRSEDLYPRAMEKLVPKLHFQAQEEKWLADVWAAAKRYHKHMTKLDGDEANVKPPTEEQLRLFYEQGVEAASDDEYDEDDINLSERFIRVAYKYEEGKIERERMQSIKAFEFLIQEGVHQKLREFADMDGSIPENLPALLQGLTEQSESGKTVGIGKLDLPFPDDEHDTPLIKVTTGVDFLDEYMGGQSGGEVYGLCAPFGVCKTTLAVQLGVERARWEQAEASGKFRATGERVALPIVYLVFYEETIKSVRIRCQSYAGRIERKIIEDQRFEEFSTIVMPKEKTNPKASLNLKKKKKKQDENKPEVKPYEAARFNHEMRVYAEAGASYAKDLVAWQTMPEGLRVGKLKYPPKKPRQPGLERERFDMAKLQMNFNLRFLDFSGRKPEYREASGSMDKGIKMIIEQDQRDNFNPGVSMVVVDYAGAAADRAMELNQYDESKLRHLISKLPLRLKTNIAVPYDCPVWVMHQLNADANSKAAGVAPKATDTAEAKNFFEHMDFGFVVGTKNAEEMAVIRSVKQRREAMKKEEVIHIHGLLCRVESQDRFMTENGRIVEKESVDKTGDIADPEQAAKAKKQKEAKQKKERAEYVPHTQFME